MWKGNVIYFQFILSNEINRVLREIERERAVDIL